MDKKNDSCASIHRILQSILQYTCKPLKPILTKIKKSLEGYRLTSVLSHRIV